MDGPWFSLPQTPAFLSQISLLIAQKLPRRALWRTALLLASLGLCASTEEDCVLGVVGRPVSLPCSPPGLLKVENLSIEWRKDDGVVLRSMWEGDEHEEMWGFTVATLADEDARRTGNFSLRLPEVHPHEDHANYSLFVISEGNQSAAVCRVCLRTAAPFSFPQLQREEGGAGDQTVFSCRSSGGYPKPTVSWLINNTEEPPEGAVRTRAVTLDSLLYNITSYLMVNISKDVSVSCIIKNPFMNESLTSTSYGNGGPTASRASEAMWMFSTGLCVVVGAMVIAGVAYQIHLDRISKKKKKEFQKTQRGYKRRGQQQHSKEETETMKPVSKETNV